MNIYFSLRFHRIDFKKNHNTCGFENGGFYLFCPIFDLVIAIYRTYEH